MSALLLVGVSVATSDSLISDIERVLLLIEMEFPVPQGLTTHAVNWQIAEHGADKQDQDPNYSH